jgi:outer membrane receptor protein involved in Fe transport
LIDGHSLKLIYGQAFREPTVLERVAGSDGLPNPDLRPERVNSYELVAQRQVSRGVLATATGFYYDVHDLVEVVLDPTDSLLHHQNAGATKARGIETSLQARLPDGHFGYLSWSHTVATNTIGDARLENSPRDLVKFGLVSPVQPWLTAAAEIQVESSRTTGAATETDPFVIGNLNLNVYPLGRTGLLSASLRITNLFGTSYASPGGRELRQASILQDGRHLMFTIETRF